MPVAMIFTRRDDREGLPSTKIRVKGRKCRGVAQPGSASALGAEGRRFESCLPDHSSIVQPGQIGDRTVLHPSGETLNRVTGPVVRSSLRQRELSRIADMPSTNVPFRTCDIYDELRDEARVIGSELKNYGGRRAFRGMAVTIKCYEDNSRVKEAVATPGEGQVLVIDGGGSCRCAAGRYAGKASDHNGWSGIVVEGCVRDSAKVARSTSGSRPAEPTYAGRTNMEAPRDLPVSVAGV